MPLRRSTAEKFPKKTYVFAGNAKSGAIYAEMVDLCEVSEKVIKDKCGYMSDTVGGCEPDARIIMFAYPADRYTFAAACEAFGRQMDFALCNSH